MAVRRKPKGGFLFEVSWEVCNKVGGIYTLLKAKAAETNRYYRGNYYLVGPYFADKAKGEFEELPVGRLKSLFEELKIKGIKCHFGKWLIEGEPKVILIDFKNYWPQKNQIKKELWESYEIDSLRAGFDFDEPVVWSWTVGKLIEKIAEKFLREKIVVHFHEWLSGAALLYLKEHSIKVGTVFTTHATTLGRTLVYNGIDFYSILEKIDPDKEIYRYNITAKHQLEKKSAQISDVFTTVSEITALEAKYFLGKKPDILLPDGLDLREFPVPEEIPLQQRIQNSRLREFVISYFFPWYSFDLDNTLFYFTAGRYEFRAKGVDILIKALYRLNQKLKAKRSRKTIIAFFLVPTGTKKIKDEIIKNKELFEDIKDALEDVSWETKSRILYAIVKGEEISKKTLFKREFLLSLKQKLLRFKQEGLPPLSTHDLNDPQDIILRSLQASGLQNRVQDRVKVVFYPIYLNGHDGLSNLSYREFILACDLGIFPSYYEPWGYTPLETAASGVPAITTDAAGFGRYSQKINANDKNPGIFVIKRFGKSDAESINSLSNLLYKFSQFSDQRREDNKFRARKIATLADWKLLIRNYIKAHNKAREFVKI